MEPNAAIMAFGLANSLAKDDETSLSVFLMGDAVSCAVAGQTAPNGYYNIERMLKFLASKNHQVGVCGSCLGTRGIRPEVLTEGAHRSSMDALTRWKQRQTKLSCSDRAVTMMQAFDLIAQTRSLRSVKKGEWHETSFDRSGTEHNYSYVCW